MTRRDKHMSMDQLASLTVGELRPRNAAKIQAHVTQCEQCTQVGQQLNAIPAILASATYPPIPQNLSARTDSAITREPWQPQAAMPPTQTPRPALPPPPPRPRPGHRR